MNELEEDFKEPLDHDGLNILLVKEYNEAYKSDKRSLKAIYLHKLLLELKHRRELCNDNEPCYYIRSCKQESCSSCKPSKKPKYKECIHWINNCDVCDIDGCGCTDGYKGSDCFAFKEKDGNKV